MELEGAVALVTGGSGDLGMGIVRALAGAGANVAVAYTGNFDGAKAIAGEVDAAARKSFVVQLDQSDAGSIEQAISATVEHFGRLEILVNNAAWNIGIPFPDLEALTPEIWDRVLDTNLRGPFLLSRAAARPMRAQGRGSIVNIASVGGLMPGSSSIAYSSSKAGLIHLTRCLAVALAPEVTVNCVAPGLIEGTRMAQRLPPEIASMARQRAVLGRASSIEDIAHQVVAFCRYDSVTGQTLVVDGGVHMH
jgi:3-oxoacyl-[acyl-carrier protein] reductase